MSSSHPIGRLKKAAYINCDEISAWIGCFEDREELMDIISPDEILDTLAITLSEEEYNCVSAALKSNNYRYQIGYDSTSERFTAVNA